MTRNASLSLRLPLALREALEARAKAEQRSLAFYVVSILEAHVADESTPRPAIVGAAQAIAKRNPPTTPKLAAADPDPRALVAKALDLSKRPARSHPKPSAVSVTKERQVVPRFKK